MLLQNPKHLLNSLKAVKPSPAEAFKWDRAFSLTIWWHCAHKRMIFFETEFRKPFNVQSQHEMTSCHSILRSWARFPSTPSLNPVLTQTFSVPFAAPAGEASSLQTQGTLPWTAPNSRRVPTPSGVVSQLAKVFFWWHWGLRSFGIAH